MMGDFEYMEFLIPRLFYINVYAGVAAYTILLSYFPSVVFANLFNSK